MWNAATTRWPVYKLAELLVDFTKKNKGDEEIPVYSVTNEKGFTISTEYFSKEVFSKNLTTYKVVEKNDFAYNPSRINVGSIDFFQHEGRGLISPLYVTFKTNGELDTKFLKYYLKSSFGNAQIRNNTSGSVRDSLSFDHLSNITIPLPPIEDQKSIVRDLNIAEQLRQKRKRAIILLDDYLRSVFLEMFGDFSDGKEELRKNIKIIGGAAFKSDDFVDEGVPIVKIGTVNKGVFDIDKCSFLPDHFLSNKKMEKYQLVANDLLMSLTGTVGKDDYGNVCKVPEKYSPCLLNQRVAKIEFNPAKFGADFLLYFFRLPEVKSKLTKVSRGIRQANISNEDIYALKINIPNIDNQNKFSEIVQKTEQLKKTMFTQVEELDTCFNALIQSAFTK